MEKEWRAYIRRGNEGAYATSRISDDDFARGRSLLASSFPIDWNKKRLWDIALPEDFDSYLSEE